MDDVIFIHDAPYGGMLVPLQRLTSLRRRAQANGPAASYRLRRVLDDGERRVQTSPLCKGCRGRSLQCAIALLFLLFESGPDIVYGRPGGAA